MKFLFIYRAAGGSMLGDVNISAILDSFSVSYDKRVRPNYGGESRRDFLHFTINEIIRGFYTMRKTCRCKNSMHSMCLFD